MEAFHKRAIVVVVVVVVVVASCCERGAIHPTTWGKQLVETYSTRKLYDRSII
jgi:hypothetical protein